MSEAQKAEIDRLMREAPLDVGGEVEEQRPVMEQMLTSIPLPPDVRTDPASLGGVDIVSVDIGDATREDVILYFHGGAYALGTAQAGARGPT